jgi:hypothetical protein
MAESSEDIRKEHLRDMGADLGAFYNALWNDVVWLHAKWNLYRQLYAHSPERVALLNKVARHFFGVIQDVMYEDVLLNLALLNDRRSRETLTLQRLRRLISDVGLRSEVEDLVEAAREACVPMTDWRNRRLAHRDLAVALATTSDPIPSVSRADIEAALRGVRAVLDRLEAHYWQRGPTAYQHSIPAGGDPELLAHYLQEGVRAEERKMSRLLAGKPLPEDLEP